MTMSPSGPFEPLPDVRIGDAEREAAATSLGEHFAAGRLDHDELEERLSAVYAARTQPEIDRLFLDLPDRRRRRPGALAAPPRRGAVLPVPLVLLLVVLLLAVITRGAVLMPLLMVWFWVGMWRRASCGRWRR